MNQTPLNESVKAIEKTIAYMQNHFHDKIDMAMMSSMAGLTASSYSRLFKKTMNVSPVKYLTRLRIERAKRLLRHYDAPVKEVSAAVGFGDEFYFSRIFRRLVGVTPSHYASQGRARENKHFIG
ncbi:helix-turn-helix domain-containing protein [Paenibacillus arenilitoris]|uniref:Helix-turn-helix transcriptional regulator n=1 Tax=Paenibacillus arenilitoris TaxID=2772299 RepID=A0A927H8F0_9BACL|nr:AraC family transcriptional regulator [Paenibacillus arenilitoris]MBD2870559.1 helix-turn-helix transcriptional regulator [Paenibacillus arenilitoris]